MAEDESVAGSEQSHSRKRRYTYDRPGTVLSDAPSLAPSSPSKVSRSGGSRSPRKATNVLRHLDVQLRVLDLEAIPGLPLYAQELISDVRNLSAGASTVPESFRKLLQQDGPLIGINEMLYEEPGVDLLHGDPPTRREIEQIVREARECSKRQEHESGWNSHSHGPLLTLVRSLSVHTKALQTSNVTIAPIIPRLADKSPIGLKKVDFVICLQSSARLVDAERHLSREDDSTVYWNHCIHEPTAALPIAISIETKPQHGGSASYGTVQLTVWSRAHLARIGEIRRDFSRLRKARHLHQGVVHIDRGSRETEMSDHVRRLTEVHQDTRRRDINFSSSSTHELVSDDCQEENEHVQTEATQQGTDDQRVCLPLLSVEGAVWKFGLAVGHYDLTGEHLREYCTLPEITIGDITTFAGAFRVIGVLLRLMHWAETWYRPWLEGMT